MSLVEIDWGAKTIRLPDAPDTHKVRLAMEKFERRLVSATPAEIQVLLGELSVSMQLENASDDDEGALVIRYRKYIKAWTGIPIDILQNVTEKWFRTETFFPPANKIVDLAATQLARRRAAYDRLKAIAEFEHIPIFTNKETAKDRKAVVEESLKCFRSGTGNKPHD